MWARPINPTSLNKMATTTMSGEKLLQRALQQLHLAQVQKVGRKPRHSTWFKKYVRGRVHYGDYNTLSPELGATEVAKCTQYLRMDIETFEPSLLMVAPLIQRKSRRFR